MSTKDSAPYTPLERCCESITFWISYATMMSVACYGVVVIVETFAGSIASQAVKLAILMFAIVGIVAVCLVIMHLIRWIIKAFVSYMQRRTSN